MNWAILLNPGLPGNYDTYVTLIGAGLAVLGLLLLLWGRRLGRILMALTGAGGGFLAGGPLAVLVGLPPLVGQIACASLLVVLGLVLAPRLWGLVFGGLFALAAGVVVALVSPQPPAPLASFLQGQAANTQQADLVDYLNRLGGHVKDALWVIWKAHARVLLPAIALVGILPAVLGVIKHRFATIFATCLIGVLLVAAGAYVIAAANVGDMQPYVLPMYNAIALGAGAVVLLALGMTGQYVGAIKAERKKKAAQEEADSGNGTGGAGGHRPPSGPNTPPPPPAPRPTPVRFN